MSDAEAFIPLDPAKRERSKALASEVVRRLAGGAAFANGGWVQAAEDDEEES